MNTENSKKLKKPKAWKHTQPITVAQLKQMREEFWDTAPHYGGQKGLFNCSCKIDQLLYWCVLHDSYDIGSFSSLRLLVVPSLIFQCFCGNWLMLGLTLSNCYP